MALSQLVYPEKKTQDVSTPVSRAGESAREPSSAQLAGACRSDTRASLLPVSLPKDPRESAKSMLIRVSFCCWV